MSVLKTIIQVFTFIVTGVAAIIVGSFMLRGNMHMWDKRKSKNDDDMLNDSKNDEE